jgi:RNA polymerase sigma factor (sigma-70 family)
MLTAMDANGPGFEVEALLREADWIKSLARGLSHLPDGALDLEQETWLAALRAKPATDRGLRPWLAAVMRNAARLRVRTDAHRSSRERHSAREEALPSSHELAARADLQRVVVEQLLLLDEPFRSTILLCFFEGLAPSEVARRQGVPAGTVRSRLSRGLELLRRRLDEQNGGDRARWLSALCLPTAGELIGGPLVTGILMKKMAWIVLALVVALSGWYGITRLRLSDTPALAGGVPPSPLQSETAAEVDERSLAEPRREALGVAQPIEPGRDACACACSTRARTSPCRISSWRWSTPIRRRNGSSRTHAASSRSRCGRARERRSISWRASPART